MPDLDFDKAKRLANLSREDLGDSEEQVKINFLVPLLETLGHARLRFEHRQKDIVLRQGLPRGAAVVVEAKRAGEPLDRHLDQLERYAHEERALLAILTNGDAVRLYAPLWPAAASFAECLLLELRREDLAHPPAFAELARLLSADALASGRAARAIADRQARIEKVWAEARALRARADEQRRRLEPQLRAIEQRQAALEEEKKTLLAELASIEKEEADTARALYGCAGLRRPAAPAPTRDDAPRPRPKTAPEDRVPWTDADLTTRLRDYPRRILAAFVRAGTRTLGTLEIARALGLSPQAAWGALTAFVNPVSKGSKEPFLEITRTSGRERAERGVLISITEKYWEAVLRLYREA